MSKLDLACDLLYKLVEVLSAKSDETDKEGYDLNDLKFHLSNVYKKRYGKDLEMLFKIPEGETKYIKFLSLVYNRDDLKFVKNNSTEVAVWQVGGDTLYVEHIFLNMAIVTTVSELASYFEKKLSFTPDKFVTKFGKLDYINISKGDRDYIKSIVQPLKGSDIEIQETVATKLLEALGSIQTSGTVKSKDTLKRDDIAKGIVNNLMGVYENLYGGDNFINKPKGILTQEGLLVLDESMRPIIVTSQNTEQITMYNLINKYISTPLKHKADVKAPLDGDYFSDTGELIYNYCPIMHLYNINGVVKTEEDTIDIYDKWAEFKEVLKNNIFNMVISALDCIDISNHNSLVNFRASFIRLMTTSLFAIEWTNNIANLRGVLGCKLDELNKFLSKDFESSQAFTVQSGKLVCCETDAKNITSIIYTFDQAAHGAEILFSYKMYDKLINAGVSPSYNQLVVGQNVKGKNFTLNFQDESNTLTAIIAGSRSGKGVLTLNIMAGLLASGAPVCYVDYKPDMSAMLWRLDEQYGTPIYATDSSLGRDKLGTTHPRAKEFGVNAPNIESLKEGFRLIPYLKSLQLLVVIANLRSSKSPVCATTAKPFFIFDEFQAFNYAYVLFLNELTKIVKEKPKKDNPDPTFETRKQYADRLIQTFGNEKLDNDLSAFLRTHGAQGKCSCICIGQSINPTGWVDWEEGALPKFLKGCVWRFSGANHSTGKSPYGLNSSKSKFAGRNFIDNNTLGYWGIHKGFSPPQGDTSITCIKSYMTLNDNDVDKALSEGYSVSAANDNTFTGSLLNRINDEIVKDTIVHKDFYEEDGSVRERVGFPGLVKHLMGSKGSDDDLKTALSAGYNLALNVIKACKLPYETVEDYLYDCSLESFFTVAELVEKAGNKNNEEEKSKKGINLNTTTTTLATKKDAEEHSNTTTNQDNTTPNDTSEKGETENTEFTEPKEDTQAQETPTQETGFSLVEETKNTEPSEPIEPIPKETDSNTTPKPKLKPPTKRPHLASLDEPIEEFVNRVEEEKATPLNDLASKVVEEKATSPNESANKGSNEHTFEFKPDSNLINMLKNDNISKVYAMNQLSLLLIKQLDDDFGLNRIHSFEVLGEGFIKVNGVMYKPILPNYTLEALPLDVQQQVRKGNVIELFNFGTLYRLSGLTILSVENPRLAEGRLRRELGIPRRKDWTYLFRKFRGLEQLIIAGNVITEADVSKGYANNFMSGFSLGNDLASTLLDRRKGGQDYGRVNPLLCTGQGLMSTVANSRTCKVATKALGYTVGLKAIMVASSLFGPWGVLFGALSVYGTISQASKTGGLFADNTTQGQYYNTNSSRSVAYEDDIVDVKDTEATAKRSRKKAS